MFILFLIEAKIVREMKKSLLWVNAVIKVYLALLKQKNNQIRYQYKNTNVETKSIKSFCTPRNYEITKYYIDGRFKIHFTIIKLQGFPLPFPILPSFT